MNNKDNIAFRCPALQLIFTRLYLYPLQSNPIRTNRSGPANEVIIVGFRDNRISSMSVHQVREVGGAKFVR